MGVCALHNTCASLMWALGACRRAGEVELTPTGLELNARIRDAYAVLALVLVTGELTGRQAVH